MAQSALPWLRRSQQSTLPAVRLREAWWLLSLPLLLFLALPVVALFLRTPPNQLLANLAEGQVIQAISLSMLTTCITLVITLIFGTPVAYLLGRYDFPFRRAIDTLLDLPTVLPPSVAGIALLMAFGRRGLVGEWLEVGGIHIAFTQVAVILAQTFIAAPFYVKAAMLGFAGVDRDLEQAALDGAGSWQAFRFVTLPLAWTALLSGAVMTWARALGEFGATIIFAGNYPGQTQTMPLAIYLGFELDLDIALTLSAILVGCSFVVLIIVKGLLQRELETNTISR
ncbi:MAG TPA: ABC transporter permease [Anaerolineae bacterium]|jgi:molybdate transport system permease protein